MMTATASMNMRVVCEGLQFPEGPVALPDGSVILVEIRSGDLSRVDATGRKSLVAHLGGGPNGAAIGPDGACYVCNSGGFEWHDMPDGTCRPGLQSPSYSSGSIQRVDLATGSFRTLYDQCDGRPLKGPNDIVFDPFGGFWFTDLGKRRQRDMDHGGVYYALPDGTSIREVIFPLNTPNGIGLSADGRRLYVAETAPGRLWAFDLAGPGQLGSRNPNYPSGGTLVAGVPDFQLFDSLAVEAGGSICVATLFNGGITVISADGSSVEHVALPDAFTTNICFTGEDMKTAFVTLSSTGRLVRLDWPRAGLATLAQSCRQLAQGLAMIELTSALQFPEGPIACADGSVLVVEIANGRLTRCALDGALATVAELGGGPNGAAIGPDGHCYVCNNGGFEWQRDPDGGLFPHGRATAYTGGSIQRVDLASGAVETLYDSVDSGPLSSPNDIVFDAAGGFWFTDLGHMAERSIERGRVCYAAANGLSIREVVFPMLTPNGIGLSPDGTRLYVAETTTARVWQFNVSAPGTLTFEGWPALSPGHLLYSAPRYCSFDSLAVEANGNVCVATLGTGGVTVISPKGELIEFVEFADRATTNLCFGGPGLRTAYVTQSRSGRLLAVPWPRDGLAPHFSGLEN